MVNELPTTALAARLRQALEASDKHQTELAALFEISDAAVSKWLKSGKIGRDRLPAIARFLGVSLQWLAEGTGSMRGNDLTPDEKVLLENYRALEPGKRPVALMTLHAMLPPPHPPLQFQAQGAMRQG